MLKVIVIVIWNANMLAVGYLTGYLVAEKVDMYMKDKKRKRKKEFEE